MPPLWGVQAALMLSQKHPLLRPKTTMSASDKSTARDTVYRCDCGDPEASANWIRCNRDDCPVGWYHWKCVQVTEEPTGDWLCPKCSHKSQEKRQLPDQPREGKTSVLPNLGKTSAARSPSTVMPKKKGGNAVADKGHVRVKKGTAIKKPTPKKTRRIEWVEITSEDEDEDGEERIKPIKDAFTAERTARMKARATQPNKKRTRSQKRQGSSKRPSKTTKEPTDSKPLVKISRAGVAKPTTPVITPQRPPSQQAVGVVKSEYRASEEGEVS
ncbi:hypothetical protein BDR22DRAFT_820511 [Usnea florida]